MKLGDMLVREGHLTRQQLAQALRVQGLLGSRLGTTLLEERLITEASLLEALGRQRSTRTVSQAELAGVPPEVVRMIPARLAERYGVVPFHLKGRTLFVASKDVGDLLREDEIGFLTSCMVRTCIALEFRIHEALERYYRISCPDRHKALVRRFILAQGNGSKAAQRPPTQPPAQQTVAPAPRPRPPQTVKPPQVSPSPPSPSLRFPASAEKQPAEPAPKVQTRPPAVVTPPSFIELDEEDAALLGISSSDSLAPSSDEPVILEPAPLPWLKRKSEASGPETSVAQAPADSQALPDVHAAPTAQAPPSTISDAGGSSNVPPGSIAPAAPLSEPTEAQDGEPDDLDLEGQLHRAAAQLRDVEIRDDIADVLLSFCESHFQRRVILVARKDHIVGWRGEGEGIEPERIREIEITAHDPSVFLGLTATDSFWLGSLPALPANQALVQGLGGESPKDCVVLPVILRSRVVCYLYGDNLSAGVAGAPVAELRRLVAKAGMAFEIYILKNKLRLL